MNMLDDDFRNSDAHQNAVPDSDEHAPGSGPTAHAESLRPGEPILVNLADVSSHPLKWLWEKWFPLGKVTVVAGLPGQGKSLVSLDIAARVSRGADWPDGCTNTLGPSGVVLFATEDDAADTIVPRLMALKADRTRIKLCEGIATSRGASRAFTLEDIDALTQAVDQTPDCRLIVIDPVSAFEPGGKGSTIQKMRSMLAAITALATEKQLAIVLVAHLNKSGGKTALARIAGSQALTAAARAVWLVAKDPLDGARRVIVPVKNNLGVDSSGLAFEITGSPPSIEWLPDAVTISADNVLKLGGDSRLAEAAAFLVEVLSEGSLFVATIKELVTENGLAWRTVQAAKGILGIRSARLGFGSQWIWCLPRDYAQGSKDAKSAKDANNANRADSAVRVVVRPPRMLPPGKASAE